ncbi:MAG: RNA methyltransferase [FCB group bacterium]
MKTKKGRDEHQCFLAEGEHLCSELISSNYKTDFIILKNDANKTSLNIAKIFISGGIEIFNIDEKQFEKLSDTQTPQDILAVVKIPPPSINQKKPFIALDGVSEPGNVGTIIRTAEWFGFTEIILGNNCADLYNPKTVRSTMGSIFRCNIIQNNNLENYIIKEYKNIELYGAVLDGRHNIKECKPKGNFGIIFGSEANSISPEIKKLLNYDYVIPGFGRAESLNVAIAAGISLHHFANITNKK